VLDAVQRADEVFVPAVTLGELHYGAEKSSRPEANAERIGEFAARCAVLACDAVTSRYYGRIKDRLRRKGTPIPENDVWIASVELQHGLTLVSRDAHFSLVEGLTAESW